jgi:hypothetical protein
VIEALRAVPVTGESTALLLASSTTVLLSLQRNTGSPYTLPLKSEAMSVALPTSVPVAASVMGLVDKGMS